MTDMHTIKAASYNIHKCIGLDGRQDVERVRQVIRRLDADIIGLQEVATGCGAEPSEQLQSLLKGLSYQTVAAPIYRCRRRGRHFGNVLLSRLKIASFRAIDLSAPRREPRGAIDAALEAEGGTLRVIITHLGLNLIERHYQLNRLLMALGDVGPEPVLLMGDLNEWLPQRRTLAKLVERFGHTPWARSFPARMPVFGLDRIYAGGGAEVLSFKAVRTSLTRLASDHLPVLASVGIWREPAGQEAPPGA